MKIAILTHFGSFQPGYALHVGWLERARMLEYYEQDFDLLLDKGAPKNIFPHSKNILESISSSAPFEKRVQFFEKQYLEILPEYDVILTADLIYQRGGNFLAYNQAIRNVIPKLKCKWFHWIHSAWVNPQKVNYPENLRFEPFDNSTLVYMNESELDGVAKMYNMPRDKVACVWNVKDFRSFHGFNKLSYEIIDSLSIQNKDIVQIFPHCTTRMDAKGIDTVIEVFAAIKRQGKKVALIFANSNSNTEVMQKLIKEKKRKLLRLGMYDKTDYLFTSDIMDKHAPLPRDVVANLFLISNLFVFASWREVSPNVLLEAKISGNLLVVSNGLPCAREFAGKEAIYFDATHKVPGIQDGIEGDTKVVKENYDKLAKEIVERVEDNSHIWKFSFNNIWETQMRPMLYGEGVRGKIAGIMSVSWFPFSAEFIEDLSKYVDHLVLYFDLPHDKGGFGRYEVFDQCLEKIKELNCPVDIVHGEEKWNPWNWREKLIRALDKVKPEYVINLDSDEQIDLEFFNEFKRFTKSNTNTIMMMYAKMVTADGREVKRYPKAKHCKAFKWYPGITYKKYQGYAIPNLPIKPKPTYHNNSYHAKNIGYRHYCFYTEDIKNGHEGNYKWRHGKK